MVHEPWQDIVARRQARQVQIAREAAREAAAQERRRRRARRYLTWPILATVAAPFVLMGVAEVLDVPTFEGLRGYFVCYGSLAGPSVGAAAALLVNLAAGLRDMTRDS